MPLLLVADAGLNSWTRRVTSASRHHVQHLEGRTLDIIRRWRNRNYFCLLESHYDSIICIPRLNSRSASGDNVSTAYERSTSCFACSLPPDSSSHALLQR